MRKLTPIVAALILLILAAALIFLKTSAPPSETHEAEKTPSSETVPLFAKDPDWTQLDPYQKTISRDEFESLLTDVFTTDDTWKLFIKLHDDHAQIFPSDTPNATPYFLKFQTAESSVEASREWKRKDELPPHPKDKPLHGLHIAIDPGHIGGEWAKMEGRWFQIGEEKPVCEGDMTLLVAELLKPNLEALGANVSLVRSTPEPITSLTPETFAPYTQSQLAGTDEATLRKFMEKLFYRTAEIHARAKIVNEQLKPDLVLCLHFNAEAWGDPTNPTLIPSSHFHILINGAYTEDEVRLPDQRFAMLEKLLQRTHREESDIATTVAEIFAKRSGLPPFRYAPNSKNARNIPTSPYLYARNLLANRLYECPVIFMEPYVMNSTEDYPRIQAGHYAGIRMINGTLQTSIFQDYADSLAAGLATHYSQRKTVEPDVSSLEFED